MLSLTALGIFTSGPATAHLLFWLGYRLPTPAGFIPPNARAPVWAGGPGVYSRLWNQVNISSDQTGRYLDLGTDNQELHSTQMAPFEVSFKYSEIFLIYPEKDSCSAIFQSLLKKTPKQQQQHTAFSLSKNQYFQTQFKKPRQHTTPAKNKLEYKFHLLFQKHIRHHCSEQSLPLKDII